MPARRRHNFPKAIKRDALARAEGFCEGRDEAGTRCPFPLVAGGYQFDHIDPEALSHRATLDNCQVLCKGCHLAKTRLDVGVIAHVRRVRERHEGTSCPHYRPLRGGRGDRQSKGFDSLVRDRDTGRILSRPASIDVGSL